MKKTDLLTPGNPLRCIHGTWVEQAGKKFYACRLDKHGQYRKKKGWLAPCKGYPDHLCPYYKRQPKPEPIPTQSA